LYECLGDSGERVGARSARTFASIEHNEAQGAMIMQDRAKMLRRDESSPSSLVAQDEQTALGIAIEAGMPDECRM